MKSSRHHQILILQQLRVVFLTGGFILFTLAGCLQSDQNVTIQPTSALVATVLKTDTPGNPTPTPYMPVTSTPLPTQTQVPSPTACAQPAGKIQSDTFQSAVLGEEIPTNIYLPPCYDPQREDPYPLMIMLHGQNGKEEQWIELGLTDIADRLITADQIPAVVIVMPQERLHLLDSDQSQYDDALVFDVLPETLERFHISSDRQFRAIGGLSRGANWAVRIGFTEPWAFGSVGAHSFTTFSGDMSRIRRWMDNVSVEDLPRMAFDIGEVDGYRQYTEPFLQRMDEYEVPYTYQVNAGGHSNEYWQAHVEEYLRWYAQAWQ